MAKSAMCSVPTAFHERVFGGGEPPPAPPKQRGYFLERRICRRAKAVGMGHQCQGGPGHQIYAQVRGVSGLHLDSV